MPICPRCGKSLSSEQALMYHLNRKYKCGTWKCHKCLESFETKFALNIHTNLCSSDRKHVIPSYDILLKIYLNSKCVFVETDSKSIIHSISPNCESIFGYKQQELIGKNSKHYENVYEKKHIWKSKQDVDVATQCFSISDNLYAYYVIPT
jgi:PAS domain-containing protein